jgi:tetratricopeptide (TPR) repeat protein
MDAERHYLFRHAVLRDAAYGMMLPSMRAALHAEAANLCEAPIERADHLHVARRLDEARADPAREREATIAAVEAAERAFANRKAEELYLRLAELESGEEQVRALRRAGVIAGRGSRLQEGTRHLEHALEGARQLCNDRAIGAAAGNLASLKMYLGEVAQAEALYHEAIDRLHNAGDAAGEALELSNLATVHIMKAETEPALELLERALRMQRRIGDDKNLAVTLGNLAMLFQRLQRHDESERLLQEALTLHRKSGNLRQEGAVLGQLAALLLRRSALAEAERFARKAVQLLCNAGDRRREADALAELARVFEAEEKFEASIALHTEALEIQLELGHTLGEARQYGNLGLLYLRQGERERAIRYLTHSRQRYNELGDKASAAMAEAALRKASG